MKVLHCIPDLSFGGASSCVISMSNLLDGIDEVDSRVCVLRSSGAEPSLLAKTSDPVCLEFQGSHRRPGAYYAFRRKLRRVVTEWRPDIVHCHLWPACRWVSSALANIPVHHVWHIHDTRDWLTQKNARGILLRAWTRSMLRRHRPSLIAVSRAAAEYSASPLRFDAMNCRVISCGIDPSVFRPTRRPANKNPVIGLAAQLRPEKGHSQLLRAVYELKRRNLSCEVWLAGSGSGRADLEALIQELDLAEQVKLLGQVSDVAGFLEKLDLFVLPSEREGLPMCLLEAMSAGVQVVATSVGGIPEMIHDGETGFLVPPGDVDALANGIERAIRDRRSRNAILNRAHQLVLDHHTHEMVRNKLYELYRNLLA